MSDEEQRLYERDGGVEIGALLEKTRKERELSLDQVEQATKIRKRYLKGLEQGDYGTLPDAVYARGFLKTYANYLGLDGEELAEQLKILRKPRREHHIDYSDFRKTGFDEALINPGGLVGTDRRGVSGATILTIIVSVLVIALVIGALYYVGKGSQTSTPGEKHSSGIPQKSNSQGSNDNASNSKSGGNSEDKSKKGTDSATSGKDAKSTKPEAAPLDSLRVAVSVKGSPSWCSIQSDGKVAYQQVAQPGFSQTFEARQKIVITTGNAGALAVEVNGQDIGSLGGDGEVVTRDFTLKSAS